MALNLMQALMVAMQTTACVIIAKTPFDVANTLRQTGKSLPVMNLSFFERLRLFSRGAPISFSALLIYNFSTTIFMTRMKHSEMRNVSI